MMTSEIATVAGQPVCPHDNPGVLVVDDEPLIRWSIAEALRDAGLAVHEAGDAASARRLLADTGLPIDVVLLDLHLPDCADLSLLDEVLRLRPAGHVVLMTAHGTPERQAEALAHGACAVMGKPFDIDTLEPLVRDAAGGRPPSGGPRGARPTRLTIGGGRAAAREVSMWPQPGDVLVSNPRATVEHEISIVPAPPHVTCPNHDNAVSRADALGRERQVDVWLTEDQTHFLRLASYRPH